MTEEAIAKLVFDIIRALQRRGWAGDLPYDVGDEAPMSEIMKAAAAVTRRRASLPADTSDVAALDHLLSSPMEPSA